jgi:hypothetical protein
LVVYIKSLIMKNTLFFLFILISAYSKAQVQDSSRSKIREGEYLSTTVIDGKVIPIIIIDGDTLPTIEAPDVTILRKKDFESREERKRYYQWRKYAAKVYPYALEAVRLYRQVEQETADMKKGKRKKYTKRMEKNLKPKYEEELKALTKTQGYILIKMVERELDKPFYKVITTIRGGWEAVKWNGMATLYGYDLKKGYNPKDDEILEMILADLALTYEYDLYKTDRKSMKTP